MEKFQYTITDEIGIHARPAGELAKLAKEFQSKITIKTETKQADAERLMAVMALGIRHGQTVTVETVGPDEKEAAPVPLRRGVGGWRRAADRAYLAHYGIVLRLRNDPICDTIPHIAAGGGAPPRGEFSLRMR